MRTRPVRRSDRESSERRDRASSRDKASLDIFWLRNESLEDSANLPAPDILAAEIIEDLQSALEELQAIADDLTRTPGVEVRESRSPQGGGPYLRYRECHRECCKAVTEAAASGLPLAQEVDALGR